MTANILLVALGGAAGSVLRYLCQRSFNLEFPYGTLLVNILGSLAIGILWGWALKGMNEKWVLMTMTGLCGGFTTFSAFSMEGVQMMLDNRWMVFAAYVTASVAGSLLACFIGFKLVN